MELTIYCYNILEQKEYRYVEIVNDFDKELLSICHVVSATNTFSQYYPIGETYMHNDMFPYIIRDGIYEWSVPIRIVTIKEFLDTFPACVNEGIHLETGWCAAGGRDYSSGKRAWELAVFLVSSNVPKFGWTVELISKLKNFIEAFNGSDIQDKTEPQVILELATNYFGAFRGKEFSPREVAELLSIEEYRAEKILINLGYHKNTDTGKYYLLEDEREKVWQLALKLGAYEYDNALKYESGSTEFNNG